MSKAALALALSFLAAAAGGIAGKVLRPEAAPVPPPPQPILVEDDAAPEQAAGCAACQAQYMPITSGCMPAGLPRSCWQCWAADARAAGVFPGGLQWFDWMRSPVDGQQGWFAGWPGGGWYHWMRPAANLQPDWIGVGLGPNDNWADLPPLPVPPPPAPGNFSERWSYKHMANGQYLTPCPVCP